MTIPVPSVNVCIPAYDTMQVATCLSLIKLMDKFTAAKIKSTVSTFKCPYVAYGRNVLTAMFLESGMDYQLFIDADMEFQPGVVGRMIVAQKDAICVPYRKKTQNQTLKFSVDFKDHQNINIDNKGLVELTKGPAGLTLIHRRVYEKLMKNNPKLKIKQKEIISEEANNYFYNFWDTTFDSKGNWYGEDVSFCNLIKDSGFQLYGVADGETTHHGYFGWTGKLVDTFKKSNGKDK
tara:strand:+ start:120 stop:824 length:705 start_codon:yes stop_codon:yes gene_type:complete